jgi:hypothetical protein
LLSKKRYNYFVSVDTGNAEAAAGGEAAEVRTPAHGFTIFEIADVLKSEHIRSLPVEIKRSSVLLALDAAGVKVDEIIQDAIRRDCARGSRPITTRWRKNAELRTQNSEFRTQKKERRTQNTEGLGESSCLGGFRVFFGRLLDSSYPLRRILS